MNKVSGTLALLSLAHSPPGVANNSLHCMVTEQAVPKYFNKLLKMG